MPLASTTKTAAFENYNPVPLSKGGDTTSVAGTSNVQIPIEVYKATQLQVTVSLAGTAAATDLTVQLKDSLAGNVAPSATVISPATSSGPTGVNPTTYTATYNLDTNADGRGDYQKVWLQVNNTVAGAKNVTYTFTVIQGPYV